MADAVSAIASVQLGVLQAPEVAREQVPLAMQAQIANAHVPVVIAKEQERTLETVLQLRETRGQSMPDTLSGSSHGDPAAYHARRRRQGSVLAKAERLAAAHPAAAGALVDVRA